MLKTGASQTVTATGTVNGDSTSLKLGKFGSGGQYTAIIIDELRVSNVARSDAWIKATNATLKDNLLTFSPGTVQDVCYEWEAGGNLEYRTSLGAFPMEREHFTFDFPDRLDTAVLADIYEYDYDYDTIGNIDKVTDNLPQTPVETDYQYKTGGSTKPHAVTQVGGATYTYDADGNMNVGTARTWDAENRLASITKDGVTTDFVYDGDGNRVKRIIRGSPDVTTLYVNGYYEKTGDVVTTSYYLGGKLIAQKEGDTLRYVHQDSLSSTSVMSTPTGTLDSSMSFFPFGGTRSGDVNTDKKFTGQRLDDTGLYFYNARYYDAAIGRFISPDTAVKTGDRGV